MENYEEKYKTALANAEFYHKETTNTEVKNCLEYAFPELRESEDERIKKEIIDFIQEREIVCSNGDSFLPYKKWIAWLEKQGEQPSWSEEDENVINHLLAICAGAKRYRQFAGCLQDDITKYQNWLKSLKDRVQPKQEWSEEDEENRINAIKYLEIFDAQAIHGDVAIPCINWLKSIKPNHWKPSEQNIKDLEWCADLVKDKMGVGFHRLQVFIDEIKNL